MLTFGGHLVLVLSLVHLTYQAVVQIETKQKEKSISKRSSVCYRDLGCFDTGGKFFDLRNRPLNLLPKSPGQIGIDYALYTRNSPKTAEKLQATSAAGLKNSGFEPSKKTKLVIHGFIENGKVTWMKKMKDALLSKEDVNVILVDWGGGSLTLYTQATANTRVVGAHLALLIKNLHVVTGASLDSFHIIGHSLGSHIAGYAGERLNKLGRISGMDPAEPYFKNTDPVVRLDHTDAKFVDVIHTDADSIVSILAIVEGGFGLFHPVGHLDFYPNGGKDQPNCRNNIFTNIKTEGLYGGARRFVVCDHLRAIDLYTDSITNDLTCKFRGQPCDSYDDFMAGKCVSCGKSGCASMGYNADKMNLSDNTFNNKLYLLTYGSTPFCVFHYKITITFDNPHNAKSELGGLYLRLVADNFSSKEISLNKKTDRFHPGVAYIYMVGESDIINIKQVDFRWKHQSCLACLTDWNFLGLRNPVLHIKKIEVFSLEHQTGYTFCGTTKTAKMAQNNKITTFPSSKSDC